MATVYYWPCDLASTALSRIKEALTALGNVQWTTRTDGDQSSPSDSPGRITFEFKSFHHGDSCALLLCSSSRLPRSRILLVRKRASTCVLHLESSIEGILSRMHEGVLATPRQTAQLDGELGHGTSAVLGTVTVILGTLAVGNVVTGVLLLLMGLSEEQEREQWRARVLPPQYFPLLELAYQDNAKAHPQEDDKGDAHSPVLALSMAINKLFFS